MTDEVEKGKLKHLKPLPTDILLSKWGHQEQRTEREQGSLMAKVFLESKLFLDQALLSLSLD